MNLPQQCFKTHYNTLLKGINRIRFIKKKQHLNHTQISNTLNKIVSTLNQTSQQNISPRNLTTRGKFKIAPINKKFQALQPTQDESSITKHSHYQQHNSRSTINLFINDQTIRNCSTQNVKLRQIQQSKWENYKQMKQMQRLFSKKKQLQQEQSLRAVREKVLKVTKQKQQGRRKIENNYFQYINQIHLNKQENKDRKIRMTEKKHEEIEQLQKEEQKEIQMYESTLALEHHLKKIIEGQLRYKEEKSTMDFNDSL